MAKTGRNMGRLTGTRARRHRGPRRGTLPCLAR